MAIARRLVGGLVAGGIAVFAGTSAMEDKTTRDEAGAIVESGGLGVFTVRTGDCVQLPTENLDMVASIEGVPCDTPHDAQVFAELTVAGDEFPGREAMENTAGEQCVSRWEAALGAYDPAGNLDLTFFTPTEESWEAENDREVTCFVVSADGTPITGSKLL